MQFQVDRFLAITALLASAAALSVGCVSEDNASTTNDGSVTGGTGGTGATGGTGGSTGGAAGSATGGAAGTATGGAGGAAGSGGTAGTGGGTCLGDTPTSDASAEGIDCSTLSYYTTDCGADAGNEGAALGAALCDYMAINGRAGVNDEMLACLGKITGDACAAAHDTAVQACMDTVFPKACQHDPVAGVDGGLVDQCKELSTECPAITEADCNNILNPLTTTWVDTVLTCYQAGSGACDADFNACLQLPE